MGLVTVVKQTLSEPESKRLLDFLTEKGLHPWRLYVPSLSGMTAGIFKVLVPDAEADTARGLTEIWGRQGK